MKKRIFTILSFLILAINLCAQIPTTSVLYGEKIHLHINSDLLLTGEVLFFKVYCLNAQNNSPTDISTIVYVELINENQKPFLQTKISLTHGVGAGDFFLPATMPSGNYTLIAYTKWMRNFAVDQFFKTEITVINPFKKNESLNKKDTSPISLKTDSTLPSYSNNGEITVTADKEKSKTREKISITIKNADSLNFANVSISVHIHEKTNRIKRSIRDLSVQSAANPIPKNRIQFLPELRGELISGKVADQKSRAPSPNIILYLSSPAPDYTFMIAKTDSSGRFHFNLQNISSTSGMLLQTNTGDSLEYSVSVEPEFLQDYSSFMPSPFVIDTTLRKVIEQRNVFNQIENAYYNIKKDSIVKDKSGKRFYGRPDKIYNLDSYTRFPTMEDVFREYVAEVIVKKRNENFSLQLISAITSKRLNGDPLILLDGLPIFNTNIIMNYNPLKVKKIEVVAQRYYYSALSIDGIVSFETYDGDARDLKLPDAIPVVHTNLQPEKIYYSPVYTNSRLSRIPDYRTQLFWDPALVLQPASSTLIEFYTSDIQAEFVIEVEGFLSNGKPVHFEHRIQVADDK